MIAGIDEFLDSVTVLPPGEWDPSIRIEPPDVLPSQEGRIYRSNPSRNDAQVSYIEKLLNLLYTILAVCLCANEGSCKWPELDEFL